MNDIINYVIIGLSLFASGWLFTLLKKQKECLKVKAYLWNGNRVFIVILVVISILPLISEWNNIGAVLRSILMIVTMIFMFLLQDGIGEQGIFFSGQLYSWDRIFQYDYYDYKKKKRVFFAMDRTRPTEGRFIDFDLSKEKEVQFYLQKHIARKYHRTKKTGK